MTKTTYKDSGVDVQTGNEMVQSIKETVEETHGNEVLTSIGGFGGLFQPDFTQYQQPVLVSSTDGVGTKVLVALKTGIYDTVGQDLVNHCVNDIAVCGADPLFFLDYYATGKLDSAVGEQIVTGFAAACKKNEIALIGGETAEMPDVYANNKFDLAGTITGVVNRDQIIDGSEIEKGDILLGFKSSGLHTNGYSLARKTLFSKYDISDQVDELGGTLGEEMLSIHKSYLDVIKALRNHAGVHGFSHVTGGGITENTNRILPDGCSLDIDWDRWKRPPVFNLIQKIGNVPEADMRRSFNLGVGLIAIVNASSKNKVTSIAKKCGEEIFQIGEVV